MVLAGSAVRNAATAYSDIDLAHIMAEGYAGPEKRFHYRDGRLISVSMRTMSWWRRAVTQPERASFWFPPCATRVSCWIRKVNSAAI
jgi:predicted nucleotidyltransferase